MTNHSERRSDSPRRAARVLLVTGSYPPDACGVGDHSHALVTALERAGVDVEVYCRKDWSVLTILKHSRAWRAARVDTIILAHPTDGYRKSPAPNFALAPPQRARKIVVLHEFSRKSRSGKLACYLFFHFADWMVFTSEIERSAALKAAPWLAGRSSVIPLASSIPVRERRPPDIDVACFGLIRPGKGIEDFLDIIERAALPQSARVRIIGQTAAGLEAYADAISDRLAALGGEVIRNLPPDQAADHLSRTRIVVLPFPDGISKRRSSALAVMANGALVLTITPRHDQDLFDRICLSAPNPRALGELLVEVLADPAKFEHIADAGMDYARSLDWDGVVDAWLPLLTEGR